MNDETLIRDLGKKRARTSLLRTARAFTLLCVFLFVGALAVAYLVDVSGAQVEGGGTLAGHILRDLLPVVVLIALLYFGFYFYSRRDSYPRPRGEVGERRLAELLEEPEGTLVWVGAASLLTTADSGEVFLDGEAEASLSPREWPGAMGGGSLSLALIREGDGFNAALGSHPYGIEINVVKEGGLPRTRIPVNNLVSRGEPFEVCANCGYRHAKGEGEHG